MPSHEPELYKDKIEVSLDGRQIFYLFFGGAVIVGLVFVLGVMVGRRVEARGHLDRADTQSTSDPLAALDRLERSDHLSFRGALTGAEAPTDVEKAIGELEKRRAATPADKRDAGKPEAGKASARPEAKIDAAKPEAKSEAKSEAKIDAAKADAAKADAAKADAKPDAARSAAAASPPAAEARAGKPEDRSASAGRTESKTDARNEPVTRPDADRPKAERDTSKHDGDKRDADKRDADKRDTDRHDADRHDADKHDADKKARKHDDTADAGRADAKKSSGRFTLQLSSFQDRSEAEAFLGTIKSAGFQPYLTEAEVTGKGTFYRVRLGSYRSLDAANDAKAEYEKTARKAAQVMRL